MSEFNITEEIKHVSYDERTENCKKTYWKVSYSPH
jgi:hypothetical protein